MKISSLHTVTLALLLGCAAALQSSAQTTSFEFYEGTFNFHNDPGLAVKLDTAITEESVRNFYYSISKSNYQPLIAGLLAYKDKYHLNDWLYYQLIRKTAQQLSPKAENYPRYTLYKWFLMTQSGYDARLAVGNNQIIFYVRNDEDISDIPFFMIDNRKYMCLNYHDYGKLFKNADTYHPVKIVIPSAANTFSYKVTRMPDFKPENYVEKQIDFTYRQKQYHFKVKLNSEVQSIFANYPGVDFETYFNIPLSRETYESLIPLLRKNLEGMSQKKGVDYLMRFTRYAFLYEDDEANFGREKRLSPEQTLLTNYSDCDDRAALFFYLVKEIYNLPMIALLYPTHMTMAVQFDKPSGKPVLYNGKLYTICEPTPQGEDLRMGQVSTSLRKSRYEVIYAYEPRK